MGTDPCWPQLLAPADKDMAQPHSPGRQRWLRCRTELEVPVTAKGRNGPCKSPAPGSRDRQLVPLVPCAMLM